MDPCTLTETGANPQILLACAALFMIILGLFVFSRKARPIVLIFVVAFSLAIPMFSAQVSAQSLPDECTESSEPGDDSEGVVLGLADDFGLIQIPDSGEPFTSSYVGLISNDTPPEGDPYDLDTIDLNTSTAGQQTERSLRHPDDNTYQCGTINLETFGIISVNLEYDCYDESFNTQTIPSDYTIPVFQYTAQTIGGNPAPTPANVTINTQTDPVVGTVTAVNDSYDICPIGTASGLTILSNDSTSVGTLNTNTVDLNASLAGVQSSITIQSGAYTYTITASAGGTLSVQAPPGAPAYDQVIGFYTVQNTNGDTSNLARVEIGCYPST